MHSSVFQTIFLGYCLKSYGHLGLVRNERSGNAEQRIFFPSEFGPGPVF